MNLVIMAYLPFRQLGCWRWHSHRRTLQFCCCPKTTRRFWSHNPIKEGQGSNRPHREQLRLLFGRWAAESHQQRSDPQSLSSKFILTFAPHVQAEQRCALHKGSTPFSRSSDRKKFTFIFYKTRFYMIVFILKNLTGSIIILL